MIWPIKVLKNSRFERSLFLLRDPAPRGVLPHFQHGGSVPIFGVPTLNQYLGSVNYNMDKNSIFGVHKSEDPEVKLKLLIIK